MADLRGFDANQVEPTGDFEPIPAGKYLAVITESEMKPNKAGTGSFLQLTFQIIEGAYQNRLLWTRLNLDHPNATAVQIASAELSAICARSLVSVAEGERPVFGAAGLYKKRRILILWVLLLFTRNPKENKDASEEGSRVVFRVVRRRVAQGRAGLSCPISRD